VLAAGEEQGDAVAVAGGDDPEVNTPVRASVSSSAAAARRCSAVSASTFIVVSSL